jgi:hypothetical protein
MNVVASVVAKEIKQQSRSDNPAALAVSRYHISGDVDLIHSPHTHADTVLIANSSAE